MPRDAVSRTAHVGTVGINGLKKVALYHNIHAQYICRYSSSQSIAKSYGFLFVRLRLTRPSAFNLRTQKQVYGSPYYTDTFFIHKSNSCQFTSIPMTILNLAFSVKKNISLIKIISVIYIELDLDYETNFKKCKNLSLFQSGTNGNNRIFNIK